jgi:hypothetical protein
LNKKNALKAGLYNILLNYLAFFIIVKFLKMIGSFLIYTPGVDDVLRQKVDPVGGITPGNLLLYFNLSPLAGGVGGTKSAIDSV